MSILRDALERHRRRASTTGAGGLPEGIVKETVDASDARVERSRVSVGGYVHVSTLVAGFCTRMRVISVRHEVPVVRRVTGSHRVVWKRGLTAEEHLRSGFIKVRRSSVFGEWTCVCGHTRHRGHYPSNREGCERCRQRPRHYKGLTLFSPHHGVVGNADMVFDWEGHYVPVEIKSLDNRQQWERMDAPVADHVFQVLFYKELLRLNGFRTHNEAVIVYVLTNFRYGSPYKEFHVTPTSEHSGIIRELLEEAREARDALNDGVLPPRRPECRSPSDEVPRKCPTCSLCFNLPD